MLWSGELITDIVWGGHCILTVTPVAEFSATVGVYAEGLHIGELSFTSVTDTVTVPVPWKITTKPIILYSYLLTDISAHILHNVFYFLCQVNIEWSPGCPVSFICRDSRLNNSSLLYEYIKCRNNIPQRQHTQLYQKSKFWQKDKTGNREIPKKRKTQRRKEIPCQQNRNPNKSEIRMNQVPGVCPASHVTSKT